MNAEKVAEVAAEKIEEKTEENGKDGEETVTLSPELAQKYLQDTVNKKKQECFNKIQMVLGEYGLTLEPVVTITSKGVSADVTLS